MKTNNYATFYDAAVELRERLVEAEERGLTGPTQQRLFVNESTSYTRQVHKETPHVL